MLLSESGNDFVEKMMSCNASIKTFHECEVTGEIDKNVCEIQEMARERERETICITNYRRDLTIP